MAVIHGRYGPTHPLLGALAARIAHPLLRRYAARYGFHTPDSAYARERGADFRRETATRRAHLSGRHRTRRPQQRRGTDRGLARRRDPPDLQQRGGALQRHPPLRHLARTEPARHADDARRRRHRSGSDPRLRRKLGLRHAGRDAAAQHRRGTPCQPRLPPAAELRADERTPYRACVPLAPAAWAATGAGPRDADHRHAASRQPCVFLLRGVAVRRQRRTGDGQRARRHRRRWRHLALPGARRERHAGAPQSRHLRFARRLLQHDQLDPGRLDDPQQRGSLHGLRRVGRRRPADQSVLPPAARRVPLRTRRHGAVEPRAGELAAQPAGGTLHQGAA